MNENLNKIEKLNKVIDMFAALKNNVSEISEIWDDKDVYDIISAADKSFPFEDSFDDVAVVIKEWCDNVISSAREEVNNLQKQPAGFCARLRIEQCNGVDTPLCIGMFEFEYIPNAEELRNWLISNDYARVDNVGTGQVWSASFYQKYDDGSCDDIPDQEVITSILPSAFGVHSVSKNPILVQFIPTDMLVENISSAQNSAAPGVKEAKDELKRRVGEKLLHDNFDNDVDLMRIIAVIAKFDF